VLLASEGLGNDSIAARLSMPRRFCHVSRRLQSIAWSKCSDLCELHDAYLNAGVVEKVTAAAGCWNILVVPGSTAEEVAEFIVLSAEAVCCVMLLETAHTSDPSFDPAMVLFKSIIQVDARPVTDVVAKR
jgi:hypothetical protein